VRHVIEYSHEDDKVGRVLDLSLIVEIDPGQAGITRLDPGRCEPAIGPSVVIEGIRVLAVTFGRIDPIRLSVETGSLSQDVASALANEFEGRWHVDDKLREAIDKHCLAATKPD
jgi:hypothetical protein